MKITRKQLRKIIIEEAKSTPAYDDDPALSGGQTGLPDSLQKAIIKKSKKKKGTAVLMKRMMNNMMRLKAVQEIST